MKNFLISLFIAISTVMLTSCWDMRDIDTLGLVSMVGIDKVKGTSSFRVTVQIPKPSSSGQGTQTPSSDEPIWTASAEGDTIFEAIRNLAEFSSRRVMWAHNNVIIISDSVAREDITPVINFFTHNPELRLRTWIAICDGNAREYVATKTGIETIPGMSLSEVFRYNDFASTSIKTEMLDLFRNYLSDTIQPMVSAVHLKNREIAGEGTLEHGSKTQIELAGAAIFKGSKMIGWISPEETRGLGWVRGEVNNAVITVSLDRNTSKEISIEIKGAQVKINSVINNKEPQITIKVSGKGKITEVDTLTDISIDQLKSKSETAASNQIKQDIEDGLKKIQKDYKSDVLGLGRIIHIQHKKDWNDWIEKDWENIYPSISITVEAKIDINSNTLYQKPLDINSVGK